MTDAGKRFADACRAAQPAKKHVTPPRPTKAQQDAIDDEGREGQIVNAAFRMLEPVIKGWLRARVRQGSTLVESVAALSKLLEAGGSIVSALGGIASAVESVRKVTRK